MQSQAGLKEAGLQDRIQQFFGHKWENLTEKQKNLARSFWRILTYKWQWQIAINSPVMIIWVLDKTIPSVHQFNLALLASLPLPNWLESLIGLS